MVDDIFVKGIGNTGYPFEIIVEDELRRMNVQYLSNYPVAVLPDPSNLPVLQAAIDFRVRIGNVILLIECKRSFMKKWAFFHQIDRRVRLLTAYEQTNGWGNPVEVSSREHNQGYFISRGISTHFSVNFGEGQQVMGYAVKADKKLGETGDRDKSSEEIRKAAHQASIAAISEWNDVYVDLGNEEVAKPRSAKIFIPIIVTAADLAMVELSGGSITAGGTIKADHLKQIPQEWVIMRSSLPRSLWLPRNSYETLQIREMRRKIDILVVKVENLSKLFKNLAALSEIIASS